MKKIKDKYKVILIIIMLLAILFRLFFICKMKICNAQYDVGIVKLESEADYDDLYENFDKDEHEGRHINYIMHIYKYNSLPNKIIGQFYHPPLHHTIMAIWLRVMDNFSELSSVKLESLQFITLFYSIIILISLYKILGEIGLEDKDKILPMILFSFYPIYIFLSGSINNDELVIMFCILVYLYLLKWEKKPTIFNTICFAVSFGLGFMTKSSMAVMIIPAVYIYFKVLNEYVMKEKSIKKIIIELLIFVVIAGTLGLWFHIRSLLNQLDTIGIIQPFEDLRVRTDNVWYRFGLTNILEWNDVNVWNYLIYTSLNYGFKNYQEISVTISAILVVFLFIDILYYSIKYFKENKMINITIISWILGYIYLNVSMPYICSMHSRYMVIPISLGIVTLAKGLAKENSKFMKMQIWSLSIILSFISIIYFL